MHAILERRLLQLFGPRPLGDSGQTMAEYAVVVGIITVVLLAALIALSSSISGRINGVVPLI